MPNDYNVVYQMRKKGLQTPSIPKDNDPTRTEVKPEDFKTFGKYGSGETDKPGSSQVGR